VPGLDPSVLPEWVLVPRTPDWRILGQLEVADRAPETDRFEFRGVLPGSYYLYPIVSDRARERGSRPLWYTGRVAVEVVDGDVTELVSQVVPGREVAGVVTGDLVAGRVRLSLIPLDYDVAALVNQASGNLLSPDEEGRFRWENIPAGRYRVIVLLRRPPVDAYVADIRLGARSLYENPVIDVGAGLNEMLEVVIAGDGGVLGGRVEDRAGREVTGPAFVVLVPAGAGRANPMLYRTGEVSGGRFRLTGVAPGSYRLFALAGSPPPGVEPNAEFTARFEPWAVPVLVRMGEPNAEIVVRPAPALE
jgi:hypothetical protein